MRVLVTGGAGYIGSHAARRLLEDGHRVLIVDNLFRGHLSAVEALRTLPGAADRVDFVVLDTRSTRELTALLADARPDACLHFAAMAYVEESTRMPLEYHSANVAGTISTLQACRDAGVERFVLSSTCTYYGEPGPERLPITEMCDTTPIHPYGWSKRCAERAMFDYAEWCAREARPFACGALRYFNVAGCDAGGLLGEDHRPETHLIPICIEAAMGLRPFVEVRGDDYPTPDGSCLRDYVHVDDLVDAHVSLLGSLKPGDARAYNLGLGVPFSVKQVVDSVKRVSGRDFEVRVGPRRAGDAAALYASGDLARTELGWDPRFTDLDAIVQTAWAWRSSRPDGYASR
ncbi:MAG: UDP-glucose 4-epimerase GalE [Phycisphaerales bacterium]